MPYFIFFFQSTPSEQLLFVAGGAALEVQARAETINVMIQCEFGKCILHVF